MGSAIRLYFDENVEVEVARQMRERGIEAVTVHDLGLLGDTDENQLARATRMGYVPCTYDADYLRMVTDGVEHSGIVFAFQEKTNIGDWVKVWN